MAESFLDPAPNVAPEYDLVIAGGGTCGCIIASRLADADPNLKILVLEAGLPTRNLLSHLQPARYLHHLYPTANTVRFHSATPTPALGNRPFVTPTGQCLGGGSSVNFAMYTRGAASDFDDWETVHGNPGWGSKDMIPLMKKSETYEIKKGAFNHGDNGPLKVSWGGMNINVGKEYLDTARKFDTARNPGNDDTDVNDLVTINTYGRWQKWINPETGHRSDVPHGYIYDRDRQNIHIVTAVHVRRLVIEGKRATGVEFTWNHTLRPEADTNVHTVRARKLVVVSAGTFGSPGVLERSGVGAAAVLKKIGVEPKVELPGVGEGYQDHNVCFVPYQAADYADTLDFVLRNEPEAMELASSEWKKNGQNIMAHNGIDGGVKIRPTPEELEAWGPEFKKRWEEYFVPSPDKPVMWLGQLAVLFGDPSTVPAKKYYCMGFYNQYPIARGHVHATDAKNVLAPTDFRPGFFEDMADVRTMVWAYKFSREIARRMPMFRGEVPGLHPKFAAGSKAAVLDKAAGPVPMDAPRLVYGKEDDAAVEKYVREFVSTAWHSLGTCAMKPKEKGGVVDGKLNVYGLEGVKVCDMSIVPSNVSANTYATAIAVGEKGAVVVGEALGLKV